jgi:hypothetical protein
LLLAGDGVGPQLRLGVEHGLHEPRVRVLGRPELLGDDVDRLGGLVDREGADEPDEQGHQGAGNQQRDQESPD